MTRRSLLKVFGLATAGAVAARVGLGASTTAVAGKAVGHSSFTREQWAKLLPADAYGVLFEENTERPNSSPLYHEHRDGTFICAACYNPIFEAKSKFESGTGWPSFFSHIDGAIGTKEDRSFFSVRTEYHCAHCDGHMGHVFDDGPQPTGLRYCNNGLALNFVQRGAAIPALRG